MKPVNNALHPGWGTMGTFVMPQNARANFYCSAADNAAYSSADATGDGCAAYLHDLCYTPDSRNDCAAFGGDLAGDDERTPQRCVGYWDRDTAVRTACRAHTRSKHNWVASSEAMQNYCNYADKGTPAESAARRIAHTAEQPSDPRRMQCAHWCSWFCRLDTPEYKVSLWSRRHGSYVEAEEDRFMCNPQADATSSTGAMQAAGAWCEAYMLGSGEGRRATDAMARADGSTTLGAGGKADYRLSMTDPTLYGFCAADYAKHTRNINVCGCYWAGTKSTYQNTSSLPYCDADNSCARYGFLPSSKKGQACPDCFSSAGVTVMGSITQKDCTDCVIDLHANASSMCSTGPSGEETGCADSLSETWLALHRHQLSYCGKPTATDNASALLSTNPKCTDIMSAADHDDQWVASVLYATSGDATSAVSDISAGGLALSTEPATASSNDVLCFRHEGRYRCARNRQMFRGDPAVPGMLLLGTRLRGDRTEDSASRNVSAGTAGVIHCAKMCTTDAVYGIRKSSLLPDEVSINEESVSQYSDHANVGRCVGFRVNLVTKTCTPYGIQRVPTNSDIGSTPTSAPRRADVGGSTIGTGRQLCDLGCDVTTSCASTEINSRLPVGSTPDATTPAGSTPAATTPAGSTPDTAVSSAKFVEENAWMLSLIAVILAGVTYLVMRRGTKKET
jgi:hypothetical protein